MAWGGKGDAAGDKSLETAVQYLCIYSFKPYYLWFSGVKLTVIMRFSQ